MHTKNYLFISDDLHHQYESREENPKGGLLCQDCHTSVDIHGDGNIHGTTMGQVEIECSDCHGRPDKYPWELPIGYADEFGKELNDKPHGLAEKRLQLGWRGLTEETTYNSIPFSIRHDFSIQRTQKN